MTMYKRGTQSSSIIVSSSVYSCTKCDYTEMVSGDKDDQKKCPVCDADMTIISASAEEERSDDNDK